MADPASDISSRINAERVLIIAWLRAILLQLAHPLHAAGVADHSTLRGGTIAAVSGHHQTHVAGLRGPPAAPSQRLAAKRAARATDPAADEFEPNADGIEAGVAKRRVVLGGMA